MDPVGAIVGPFHAKSRYFAEHCIVGLYMHDGLFRLEVLKLTTKDFESFQKRTKPSKFKTTTTYNLIFPDALSCNADQKKSPSLAAFVGPRRA